MTIYLEYSFLIFCNLRTGICRKKSIKWQKTKKSWKFVDILSRQCRSPFNLTNSLTKILKFVFDEFEIFLTISFCPKLVRTLLSVSFLTNMSYIQLIGFVSFKFGVTGVTIRTIETSYQNCNCLFVIDLVYLCRFLFWSLRR